MRNETLRREVEDHVWINVLNRSPRRFSVRQLSLVQRQMWQEMNDILECVAPPYRAVNFRRILTCEQTFGEMRPRKARDPGD